jgi:predicted dehydrogenase/threonine dehydrogenase-like Zn-dependent dehydrogenase
LRIAALRWERRDVKQVIQSYRSGKLAVTEVPAPSLQEGELFVQTAFSAVSLGTEGTKVVTARQNLLQKARSRPEQVKQVLDTVQREGLASAYRKVVNKLDQPVTLGYSASGIVMGVGPGVSGFEIGDRVACGGEDAAHAEYLSVGANLCARVPASVPMDQAAFATIGAIAMQGVRLAEVTLGECVVVIGLGLVGQLAVQLLKANGCRVIGLDLDQTKIQLAQSLGADIALPSGDPGVGPAVRKLTHGFGADAVIITASTSSNEPVSLAGDLCRSRGRVIVVGAVGLTLPRKPYYEKELLFRISCSYGPGRYDPAYESDGVDYPIGYVRWTEQRNMQAFLDLLAQEKLKLAGLITHRYPFQSAEEAYNLLANRLANAPAPLGVLFEYRPEAPSQHMLLRAHAGEVARPGSGPLGVGFVGAGSFARKFLLPALHNKPGIELVAVATATGVSGQAAAARFGFASATTSSDDVIRHARVKAVFVATQHDMHARTAAQALRLGKHVFVEKPLALSHEELDEVVDAYTSAQGQSPVLMVGFNRRFAPLAIQARAALGRRVEPLVAVYRVNAGYLDGKHWTQDASRGGGRILGEACHFVDWLAFVTDQPVTRVFAAAMDNAGMYHDDNVAITLSFADGSVGTVLYHANGSSSVSKEQIDLHWQGMSITIDDFRRIEIHRSGKVQKSSGPQDKGHAGGVAAFVDAASGARPAPIAFAQLVNSSRATLAVLDSLRTGLPVQL